MTTKKEDKDKIAKDGETISVPLHLMDGQQRSVATDATVSDVLHRPGYVIGDHRRHGPGERLEREAAAAEQQSKKNTAREKYETGLQNAWRQP